MFQDCTSLKKVPPYNVSNGYQFVSMFENCTSLQEKPNLVMPNEENEPNTTDMFKGTPFE